MTKEERKEYMKAYNKQYRLKNRESEIQRTRAHYNKNKDDHYTVYYLPNDNYVGVTSALQRRLKEHACRKGRDVSNYEVLFTTTDKKEAWSKERELHARGYGGFNTGEYTKN